MRILGDILIFGLVLACQEPYSFNDSNLRLLVVDGGISTLIGESYVSIAEVGVLGQVPVNDIVVLDLSLLLLVSESTR